jgi:hypothetical protein
MDLRDCRRMDDPAWACYFRVAIVEEAMITDEQCRAMYEAGVFRGIMGGFNLAMAGLAFLLSAMTFIVPWRKRTFIIGDRPISRAVREAGPYRTTAQDGGRR